MRCWIGYAFVDSLFIYPRGHNLSTKQLPIHERDPAGTRDAQAPAKSLTRAVNSAQCNARDGRVEGGRGLPCKQPLSLTITERLDHAHVI